MTTVNLIQAKLNDFAHEHERPANAILLGEFEVERLRSDIETMSLGLSLSTITDGKFQLMGINVIPVQLPTYLAAAIIGTVEQMRIR